MSKGSICFSDLETLLDILFDMDELELIFASSRAKSK